jgi:two-component system, OmpR family, phosphate regulon response regulator PhoB
MAQRKILVVEDETDIRDLLVQLLQREGYRVKSLDDGRQVLKEVRISPPDLLLLDLMLPGVSGLEITRELKQSAATSSTADIPIVILSAKGEENDVVLGLELGADDYLAKPFSPRELVARVRAVLRRNERVPAGPPGTAPLRLELGPLVIDTERYELLMDGEPVELTRAEFRLMWTLGARPGRVYTRGELADRITGGDSIILDRNVDVHVSSVRKKLGRYGDMLQTVRGVGYRLKD